MAPKLCFLMAQHFNLIHWHAENIAWLFSSVMNLSTV